MATFTKILSDTKTHAKVLLSFDNDSTTTATAVDASALSDHANGAKLHITHINHGIDGRVQLQFKGSSSDVNAIDIAGSNTYYGAVIKNTATNAGATGGDIEAVSTSASGYILLTLQKIGFAENA
jgi:hypothetical protein